MPQFDFFIWFSLSLSTIATFQILYYFLLYYILAPFAEIQKTLIKLHLLKQLNSNFIQLAPLNYLIKLYFFPFLIQKSLESSFLSFVSYKKRPIIFNGLKKKTKNSVKIKKSIHISTNSIIWNLLKKINLNNPKRSKKNLKKINFKIYKLKNLKLKKVKKKSLYKLRKVKKVLPILKSQVERPNKKAKKK
jgi:hypothetical protein